MAFRQCIAIRMKFMRHVRPHIQTDCHTFILVTMRKITNHIHQNLFTACLQIDGGAMAKVLINR